MGIKRKSRKRRGVTSMLKIDAENQTGQTGRSGVSAAPVRAVVACGWWVPGLVGGSPSPESRRNLDPRGAKNSGK